MILGPDYGSSEVPALTNEWLISATLMEIGKGNFDTDQKPISGNSPIKLKDKKGR
jgi:hypothetical protein